MGRATIFEVIVSYSSFSKVFRKEVSRLLFFAISLTDRDTNCEVCLIYQKKTKESICSRYDGQKSLTIMLPKFVGKNALDFDIKRIICSGEDHFGTVKRHQTSHHKIAKLNVM